MARIRTFAGLAPTLGLLALCTAAGAASRLEGLTAEEKALANTVDHWGLPFGDQLTRFRSHFLAGSNATFAVGVTHDLVKILPNKYWFRGQVVTPGETPHATHALIGYAGETVSLQLAVLAAPGRTGGVFRVSTPTPAEGGPHPEISLFREVFIRTPTPPYPRMASERWPDPLVPGPEGRAGALEPAVFWVDIAIPAEAAAGQRRLKLEVTEQATGSHIKLDVPLTIVTVPGVEPKQYPLVAWFIQKSGGITLTDEQFRNMCAMVLDHHMQPAQRLEYDPENPDAFDGVVEFLLARGQTLIQVATPPGASAKPAAKARFDALYEHLKQKQWLSRVIAYSNADEPDIETFAARNVPFMQHVRKTYPGLRVFLASELHDRIADGCDIVMTDLSSERYDPLRDTAMTAPELWHYYCHLPVRWQMRAPLVLAPNMQIDNPALQHRLAVWMSYRFGAKGVFIWAGNREWDKVTTVWKDAEIKIEKPYSFPYGGVHNGNGMLVYPPRTEGGPVLPSLRLKVLRNAVQDVALLRACKKLCDEAGVLPPETCARLRALLDPVPELFQHPHYYDALPAALLGRRKAILRLLDTAP